MLAAREDPEAGSLLVVRPRARGLPHREFAAPPASHGLPILRADECQNVVDQQLEAHDGHGVLGNQIARGERPNLITDMASVLCHAVAHLRGRRVLGEHLQNAREVLEPGGHAALVVSGGGEDRPGDGLARRRECVEVRRLRGHLNHA